MAQELFAAQQAWHAGNEGKARVCARRAVAVAAEAWSAGRGEPPEPADAMAHLRRIRQQATFPLSVREAAERLITAVTRRHEAPFTADPISDASVIISHLVAATPGDGAAAAKARGSTVASADGSAKHPDSHPVLIVLVMGVSGAGKTTIGRRLAEVLGWRFLEGDDFHPSTNVDKMRSGRPLTDADRRPWLDRLHAAIIDQMRMNEPAVIACSVLKGAYRTIVEQGCARSVRLVYLKGTADLFRRRVGNRRDHFMPQELVDSQLAILEEPADALVVDAALPPDDIVRQIRRSLAI